VHVSSLCACRRADASLYSAKITADIYHRLTALVGVAVPKDMWLDRSLNMRRISNAWSGSGRVIPKAGGDGEEDAARNEDSHVTTEDSDFYRDMGDQAADGAYGTENKTLELRNHKKYAHGKMNLHKIQPARDSPRQDDVSGRGAELREELKEAETGIRAAIHISHLLPPSNSSLDAASVASITSAPTSGGTATRVAFFDSPRPVPELPEAEEASEAPAKPEA
jgi:hypothetical protein